MNAIASSLEPNAISREPIEAACDWLHEFELTAAASDIPSASTRPFATEPTKHLSGATTICPPTAAGDETDVATTVANATRRELPSSLGERP